MSFASNSDNSSYSEKNERISKLSTMEKKQNGTKKVANDVSNNTEMRFIVKHLLLSCVHAEQETEHIIKLMELGIVSFLLKNQKQTSSVFRLDVLLEYDCLLAGNFQRCCFLMSSAEGWG